MRNKSLIVIPVLIFLATTVAACGGSSPATPAGAIATSEPTISSPTESTVPLPTDTSAPQPTKTIAAATQPATTTVSFASDVLPIFESRCINCHGGEQTKEGLDLKSFDSLMTGSKNGSVLTPGNADDSLIIKQLLNGKMPKRGPKLTPSQVQIIVNWVNTGALNN